MGWKGNIRDAIENYFGIYVSDSLPRGCRWDYDVKQDFPQFRPKLIVDVGANLGQSAIYYSKHYPEAVVYSFEPVRATYEKLLQRTKKLPNVKSFNEALGNEIGNIEISLGSSSEIASIANTNDNSTTEVIRVDTLDNFCVNNNISTIDYLKIDTEGFDLKVLQGAKGLFSNSQVTFVEVEASMNVTNDFHVSYEELKAFLEIYGFYPYAIYEQCRENEQKGAYLRRVNAAFVLATFSTSSNN